MFPPLLMVAPWIRKYQPKTVKEVIARETSLGKLKDFVLHYDKQKKKAAIIYGGSGSGKTCSVYALANDLNYEILEINASDFRNKEAIEHLIGGATKQRSLFSVSKIILVDEIDGLSGTKDRGGITALIGVIKESKFPVICTATDPYDEKLNPLRKECELIEYQTLAYTSIFNCLKAICEKEDVQFDETLLKSLARKADGDLRAGINDLQMLTHATKLLRKEDLELISDRNKTESMFSALMKIFKTTDLGVSKTAFENVAEDVDEIFLWLDENLPKEYVKPDDLVRAYDHLSRADVYRGRIRRWQHWRFTVYILTLLSSGVALSKSEKYKGFVQYTPTKRILKLWQANMKYAKRKAIAAKIAAKTHSSSRRVIQDTLPYVQTMMKKNKSYYDLFTREFDLDQEEVGWMMN